MAANKRSRCEEGPQEIVKAFIPVRTDDSVLLLLTLCKGPFRIVVFLGEELLADQSSEELPDDEFRLELPSLQPGFHGMTWSYLTSAEGWMVKSEVSVNGVVRFRQRKGSKSDKQHSHTALLLRVQP